MTLDEALSILDLDYLAPMPIVKEQFRWLAHFYHPDNKDTGCSIEFKKTIHAYSVVIKAHKEHSK